jgi:hypothetical protein
MGGCYWKTNCKGYKRKRLFLNICKARLWNTARTWQDSRLQAQTSTRKGEFLTAHSWRTVDFLILAFKLHIFWCKQCYSKNLHLDQGNLVSAAQRKWGVRNLWQPMPSSAVFVQTLFIHKHWPWEMPDSKSINNWEGIALRMAAFIHAQADISCFFPSDDV